MSMTAEKLTIDFAPVRRSMVDGQLRPNKITDERILTAMESLPRELFVPAAAAALAYIDEDVAVAPGRFLMEPMVLGRLVQELAVKPNDRVLEIGCNTGYGAVLLSLLTPEVWALDYDAGLVKTAADNAKILGRTISTACLPLAQGLPDHAPFAAIFVHGAVAQVPEAWGAQLAEGGRMAVVVTEGNAAALVGKARLYHKTGGVLTFKTLFDVNVNFLPGFEPRPQFNF
jgi:protein-L-isoaspartate(D-aspartate) O-methyltransferase